MDKADEKQAQTNGFERISTPTGKEKEDWATKFVAELFTEYKKIDRTSNADSDYGKTYQKIEERDFWADGTIDARIVERGNSKQVTWEEDRNGDGRADRASVAGFDLDRWSGRRFLSQEVTTRTDEDSDGHFDTKIIDNGLTRQARVDLNGDDRTDLTIDYTMNYDSELGEVPGAAVDMGDGRPRLQYTVEWKSRDALQIAVDRNGDGTADDTLRLGPNCQPGLDAVLSPKDWQEMRQPLGAFGRTLDDLSRSELDNLPTADPRRLRFAKYMFDNFESVSALHSDAGVRGTLSTNDMDCLVHAANNQRAISALKSGGASFLQGSFQKLDENADSNLSADELKNSLAANHFDSEQKHFIRAAGAAYSILSELDGKSGRGGQGLSWNDLQAFQQADSNQVLAKLQSKSLYDAEVNSRSKTWGVTLTNLLFGQGIKGHVENVSKPALEKLGLNTLPPVELVDSPSISPNKK